MTMFEQMIPMSALFSDNELEALASKCKNLIEERQRIERNELRMQLMENLHEAMNDVLCNGFCLVIQNTDLPDLCVEFTPDENYQIEIE